MRANAKTMGKRGNEGLSAGFRGDSGVALLTALVICLVIVIAGTAFLTLGDYEVGLVAEDVEASTAFWLAEAGRHHAMRALVRDYGYNAPTVDIAHFVTGNPAPGAYDVAMAVQGGGFVLQLTSTGTTTQGTVQRVVTHVAVESFARYAYFTDAEMSPGGTPIWFYTGDRIEGPVHSNGQIRFAGTPRFDDLLTTHWPTFRYYNNGNPYDSTLPSSPFDHPNFRGTPAPGYVLGVDVIPIPFTTADLRQAAQSGGLSLSGNYDVILARNDQYGTVSYRRTGQSSWTNAPNPANGVLHVQGNMNLQGKLDGLMTIGCSRDITLTDNLVYRASDASGIPNPNCDDYLGVVAEEDIVVADNTANRTDVRLNGVFMAQDTSFEVQNHDEGSFRGSLTLWGGLVQKYRGPVGTFGGSNGQTGYSKDYHFDARMSTRTPPMFPVSYRRTTWAPA